MGAVATVYTVASTAKKIGLSTGTISNLFGATKGTCELIPPDSVLASILANADPNEPEMRRTRERFGRAKTEGPLYANGGPLDMAIYNAPISVVSAWARFDCESAGPIRQSLAADLNALGAKYGGITPQVVQQRSTIDRIGDVADTVGRVADAVAGNAVPARSTSAVAQQALNVLPLVAIGIGLVLVARAVIR